MRARRRPLAGQIKEYHTNPLNPGTDPGPEGTPHAAQKARLGGAPSGRRSVPKLAPSRRWLVSSRKIPPEPLKPGLKKNLKIFVKYNCGLLEPVMQWQGWAPKL